MAVVTVHGLRELQRLFVLAGKESQRQLRRELQLVAEPVRADVERLAVQNIPTVGRKWSQMRVGVTTRLVYVAPRARGVKGRGDDPRRRPKFADLMRDRAFDPALEQNKHLIEGRVDDLFHRLANDWNRV